MKILIAASVALVLSAGTAFAWPKADDFRHKAMASDAFEIASSKMALGLSSNAKVKSFAKMMIHDHTMTTEHLLKGSGMNFSAVSSGRRQYPRATPSPPMTNSPATPAGSGCCWLSKI